jgi:hypothetical protein
MLRVASASDNIEPQPIGARAMKTYNNFLTHGYDGGT